MRVRRERRGERSCQIGVLVEYDVCKIVLAHSHSHHTKDRSTSTRTTDSPALGAPPFTLPPTETTHNFSKRFTAQRTSTRTLSPLHKNKISTRISAFNYGICRNNSSDTSIAVRPISSPLLRTLLYSSSRARISPRRLRAPREAAKQAHLLASA